MGSSRTEATPGQLLESLRRHPHAPRAWVAFSGGADSTTLLGLLNEISGQLPWPLAAVHVHHGVQPAADSWEQHCMAVCDRLGVPLHVVRLHIEPGSGGPEAQLRDARYAAFSHLLAPGELLLTAHHRQDQAETVLLHLMRGSGSAGLAGMPQSRALGKGMLLRPLLGWDREELHTQLLRLGLPWIEDPSNTDTGLDRNYLRAQVLPVLAQRWPHAVRALSLSAAQAREDVDLLIAAGDHLLEGRALAGGVLSVNPEWRTDLPRLRLALRRWLALQGCPPPPRRRLETFCHQLAAAHGDAAVSLGWEWHRLHLWQGRVFLEEEAAAAEPCWPETAWDGRAAADLGPRLGRLELCGRQPALPWPLRIATRSGGERLRSAGGHHHAVKELLRRAGVPPWLRTSVPLLQRGDETLAVGDWALSPELRQGLQSAGLELRWTPAHPLLARLRADCHATVVESARPLG